MSEKREAGQVMAKKFNIEKASSDVISGWIAPDVDGDPSRLQLMIDDHVIGEVFANKFRKDLVAVVESGKCAFRMELRSEAGPYVKHMPKGAKFRLLDADTKSVLAEVDAPGQSDGHRFENEFGEAFKWYSKGGGFIIPLSSRTSEWWSSTLLALAELGENCQEHNFELMLAYGALLGKIRERSFIPHDDDVDLVLYCGEHISAASASLEFAKRMEAVSGSGRLDLVSNGQAHIHYNGKRRVSLDVFACWSHAGRYYQNFTISGNLPLDAVLPSVADEFMGTGVMVPRDPEAVLAAIYGPGWLKPDPNFAWSRPREVAEFFSGMHNYSKDANREYWESYYQDRVGRRGRLESPPSQFAAFVTDYLAPEDHVVEFGCGNGRDSFFFNRYGWKVFAADYSEEAIADNRNRALELGSVGLEFGVCNVADSESVKRFLDSIDRDGRRHVFYSRFFLHAISDGADANLRQMVDLCARPGDLLAMETRIAGDERRPKVTAEHYRRYPDGNALIMLWRKYGWQLEYSITGTGYAKYKEDDALVLRVVMRKVSKGIDEESRNTPGKVIAWAQKVAGPGGAEGPPGNSEDHIRIARSSGFDGIELDVRMSADGVPVLMHDEALDDETDGKGGASGMKAEELLALSRGEYEGADVKVISLRDGLSACVGWGPVLLDLRVDQDDVEAIAQSIRDSGIDPQSVYLTIYNDVVAKQASSLLPLSQRFRKTYQSTSELMASWITEACGLGYNGIMLQVRLLNDGGNDLLRIVNLAHGQGLSVVTFVHTKVYGRRQLESQLSCGVDFVLSTTVLS